ncbi:MAG TPA: rRNA maturation RNase YbeY, partial [Thermomicrobiales bacterium]|nr:rRNA maturation RNase YbeY [Thermomicrobiales bacterium]
MPALAKAVAIATVTIDAQAEIPDQLTVDRVTSLVTFALESENLEGEWEFALAFVDLPTMIQMHVNFMDDDDPTDILTFPFGPDMGPGGDIAICVPVANTNAHEYGSDL